MCGLSQPIERSLSKLYGTHVAIPKPQLLRHVGDNCSKSNKTKSQVLKILVLVPGALNSIVPGGIDRKRGFIPYYGSDIIKHLTKGHEVHVIQSLLPTGSFTENGNVVYQQLKKIAHKYPHNQVEMMLLGHSSGGLYILSAINGKQDLPFIKKILFLCTPLKGTVLADIFASRTHDFLINSLKKVNLFPGINRLRRAKIRNFVSKIRVPTNIEFFATASDITDKKSSSAFNLDPIETILKHTNKLIRKKTGVNSDGIVEVTSAMPRNLHLKNVDDEEIKLNRLVDIPSFNHWHIFWNKKLILGWGRKRILKERLEFYTRLISKSGF